jgi:hypothetical protein
LPHHIIIDFDKDGVHKIQNFGEDLWGEFSKNGLAEMDIGAVDRAVNRICVVVNRSRYKTRAVRVIKATLVSHYLNGIAHVSEEAFNS